jgi:hypothetical protein
MFEFTDANGQVLMGPRRDCDQANRGNPWRSQPAYPRLILRTLSPHRSSSSFPIRRMSQAAKEKSTGMKRRSAAEEQLIVEFEKALRRKLTEQEKNLAIAQAEHIGDL